MQTFALLFSKYGVRYPQTQKKTPLQIFEPFKEMRYLHCTLKAEWCEHWNIKYLRWNAFQCCASRRFGMYEINRYIYPRYELAIQSVDFRKKWYSLCVHISEISNPSSKSWEYGSHLCFDDNSSADVPNVAEEFLFGDLRNSLIKSARKVYGISQDYLQLT